MASSAPVADFEIPGHRLVRPLGRGGMATVYLAIQASLSRPVAVKILQAPTDETITRFEQEARTIARLQHPHIIAIYEVGRTSDGQLFYTMPYLPNGDLSKLDLRESPARIGAVIRALAGALGHAHQHGIVHRDVKPENVLFDQHRRALLTDFGIARASDNLRVTRQGATMGSSGYMSPEQARGLDIDGRSDLYSLGVVCYELLTGDLPFHGTDALSTAIAHIEQPVPRLPPLKRAWQPFLDKALAKTPEERFQNAQEMIDALDAITGRRRNDESETASGLFDRLRDGAGSALLRYGVAALGVIVIAAVAGWWWRRHAIQRPHVRPVAEITSSAPAPQTLPPAHAQSVTAATPSPAVPASTTSIPAAASSSAAVTAARIIVLLAHGNALFAQNRLISPRSDNAANAYLAVLALQPDNLAAHAGVDRVLARVQQDTVTAWKRRDLDRLRTLVKRADTLAASADATAQQDWHDARAQLANDVGNAAAEAVHAHKQDRIDALRDFAMTLPAIYPAGFDPESLDAPPPPPPLHAGSPLRDEGGPQLVYVPAEGKAPAFAIARTEVTRAEYAQFAHATRRAPSSCVEQNNPFSRMHGWKWSDPGFAQGGDHPVVCVSWSDAAAYAAWLSQRTGQTYRLPDDAEWLRAAEGSGDGNPCSRGNVDDTSRTSALDNDRLKCNDGAAETSTVGRYAPSNVGAYDMYGNVSEWLAGGSAGTRAYRGLSWRDGSQQSAMKRRGIAASDIGYTSVGFRVMRVIDDSHPAPRG